MHGAAYARKKQSIVLPLFVPENSTAPAWCSLIPFLCSPYIDRQTPSHLSPLLSSMKTIPSLLLLHALLFLSLALRAHGKAGEHSNLTRESFPAGFVFGTASSAYQVEGNALKYGRGPCIWDTFLRYPGEICDEMNMALDWIR